ncbi:MAG: phosphoribosylamine--glycine ligase [Spirochaetes bacterium RBG_13_68_11]|nr:MAG: phosphoribosylamine--glycine ligase [Spirochaetes bacterium RBG_13_68_11]
MRVLVLGSGAREHALAWKLAQAGGTGRVYAGPGNAGTGAVAENLPGVDPMRFDTVRDACREHRIDCVFVGPEAPLAAGVVDTLRADGIPAIGPDRSAARLESSKAFSKAFLVRNGIPTAAAAAFSEEAPLRDYLEANRGRRLVVKKSGLAAGKGVLVSDDPAELAAFGAAALRDDEVLVEECLEGWEASVFGLSDGVTHLVLPPCTDFKRALDGDRGPNTGGMGSICPVPQADAAFMSRVGAGIVGPVYRALSREGLAYPGVLYFGLMVTPSGPKVLEFNVRFGDPETQVLLPMIDADLASIVEAMADGGLAGLVSERAGRPWAAPGAALGVVVASRGYPERSEKGVPVEPIEPPPPGEALVFHASTGRDAAGRVVTGGGRCFTVVGIGADLADASRRAYAAVPGIRFDGAWHRGDIGVRFIRRPDARPQGGSPGTPLACGGGCPVGEVQP